MADMKNLIALAEARETQSGRLKAFIVAAGAQFR